MNRNKRRGFHNIWAFRQISKEDKFRRAGCDLKDARGNAGLLFDVRICFVIPFTLINHNLQKNHFYGNKERIEALITSKMKGEVPQVEEEKPKKRAAKSMMDMLRETAESMSNIRDGRSQC